MTRITADQSDPPVIVVGAGPVGMTATAMLAREGIPVVLIEAEPVPKTDWRASTFHAATLELLERRDGAGRDADQPARRHDPAGQVGRP
jgi:3-(3-hydroxy-phenyl)propionate hydroxylase